MTVKKLQVNPSFFDKAFNYGGHSNAFSIAELLLRTSGAAPGPMDCCSITFTVIFVYTFVYRFAPIVSH